MRTTRNSLSAWIVKSATVLLILALLLTPALTASAQTTVVARENPAAVVLPGGADLAQTPDGASLGHWRAGLIVTLLGQSADGAWLLADYGGQQGWVESERLIVGSLDGVEVVETPVATAPVATAPVTSAPVISAPVTSAPVPLPPAAEPAASSASPAAGDSVLLAKVTTNSGARLNVRATPGTAGTLVAKVDDGMGVIATGRTADGTWIALTLADGTQGWASAAFLTLGGDVQSLPVTTQAVPQDASQSPAVNATQAAALPAAAVASSTAGSAAAIYTIAVAPIQGVNGALSGTLVFQDGDGTIYTYDLTTGALASRTTGFDPALSPDGSQVAFVRSGSDGGLFVIGIDGSGETRIAGYRAGLSSPKWSPDGASILFARGDDYIECYQVGNACLTELPKTGGGGPGAGGGADLEQTRETTWHVTAVNADGSNLRDMPTTYTVATPDWGSAGVVYLSKNGIQITGDGAGVQNHLVYEDPLGPSMADADIQPNGSRVVFQEQRGSRWELFAVNSDASGLAALTRPATTLVDELPSNVSPAWSPDGSQIVFLSNRTTNGSAGPWHLWVMDADGSDAQMIPVDLLIEYTYGNEQMVDWGK